MKTYDLKTEFGTFKAKLFVDKYRVGGGIYVRVDDFCEEWQGWEPFADITVNIPDSFIPLTVEELDMAPVDTNNCPWVEEFLVSNGLAKPTGKTVKSGFCEYPIYLFNRTEIQN